MEKPFNDSFQTLAQKKDNGKAFVQKKIFEIIADHKDDGSDHFTANDRLEEDLDLDSLDLVEISMQIEEEFDITINDKKFLGLQTVYDLVSYTTSVLESQKR